MIRLLSAFIAILVGTLTAWSAGGPGALLYDMVKYAVATTPTTGAVTLSGAMAGFQVLTAAGGASGQLLSYSITDTPTGWEVGRGTFLTSTSGATLTRTPLWSSNSNNAINASINAVVAVSALAEDMLIGETTGTLAARFGTTAQGIAIYNTSDVGTALPTNYERGVLTWTSGTNIFTIGTQKGGNGTLRNMAIAAPSITLNETVGPSTLTFTNFLFNGIGANIALGGLGSPFGNTFIKNNREITFTDGATVFTAITNAGTPSVLYINDNADSLGKGWYVYGGTAKVAADQSYISTTGLANVAGLSVSLFSGRTYSVEADVYFLAAATGGIQLALSGTASMTSVHYSGWIEDFPANGIKGGAQATALGTAVANSQLSGTTGHAKISGTVSPSGNGTLTVQAAQFNTSSTVTTLTQGSRLIVQDLN